MNSSSSSSTCQYLGLKNDPATVCGYPSTANHCFHCQVPTTPKLEHQEAYCLVKTHPECPVYNQPETAPLPKTIKNYNDDQTRNRKPVWRFLVTLAGILLVVFLIWSGYKAFPAVRFPAIRFSLPVFPTSVKPSPLPPTATITATATFPPPTNSPTPIPPTLEPTLTPVESLPQVHALDVPILVGKQPFLMHRAAEGDQILSLIKQHQTNLKVLEWINYSPPAPLFAGKVIVIAPGLTEIDQSLPPLEPYQVTDKETDIQGLAEKLGIDPEKLKYYNHCPDACKLVKGDWLLLPPKTNDSVPYTPTPGPSATPPSNIHALEVQIMVGNQPLLMHRVLDGEQITILTEQQQTTIEVLQEINYKTAVPLWAGKVIVIAPGLIVNVDPVLPPFEPYEVIDQEISIEDLSVKLGADLNLLKYYNACPTGCQLSKGDWLLIPRTK